jgi:anti-sigma factor (TIGR02949 family)
MSETTAPIPCSEAVRQLWDYLDRTITPEDRERIDRHLSCCRACCGELEFAKELRKVLASSTADELPPEVRTRLERFVEEL